MRTSMCTYETKRLITGICIAIAVVVSHQSAEAQDLVDLGTAANFGVLAGPAVTSTGGGTLNGDLGISPGSSYTPGAIPLTVNGDIHLANAVSALAQNHLTLAYVDAADRPVDDVIPAGQLAGLTLLPGVYKDDGAPASLGISDGGTLTLDADGDPDAVWIFQSASSLIAESGSRVVLTNGADACNVFWQVGSSATLRTGVEFVGAIMAQEAITLETLAVLDGWALARTAAVTLDNNTITVPICAWQEDDEAGYTIDKTLIDANGPLGIGDAISFEIMIVNTGLVDLVVMEVADTYDTSQLQYVDAIPASDDNVNDGTINWSDVGPLPAGSSTEIVANFIVVCTGASPFGTNNVAAAASTDPTSLPSILRFADEPYEIEHGFIGDTVWVDVNGNGIPDEDLSVWGIDGVTVNLYEIVGGVTNFVDSAETATVDGLRGQYLFDGLDFDGDYFVVVDQTTVPSAYPVNTTPLEQSANLDECGSDFTVDFGFMAATPTAVEWGGSSAVVDGDQVVVNWQTLSERDNAGFNVFRATSPDGPRTQVNAELIEGIGTGDGRDYTFSDTEDLADGDYYYYVEDVEYDGTTMVHEPVKVTVGEEATTVETIGSTALESPGLYVITADTLHRSGIHPATVDPTRLRVYVDDSEVAAYVSTEQTIWAEWDYIVFYVEDGRQVSLGYDQEEDDPLRMNFRFVFLEPGDGDVVIVRVPDDATGIHVALSREQVRYLVTGFRDSMIWLLDVTDVELPSLLLGADIIQIDDEAGVYFSETETEKGTVYAVGDSAIIEIDSIEP